MKNQKKYITFFSLIIFSLLFTGLSDNQFDQKLSGNLRSLLNNAGQQENIHVWIFFTDKGNNTVELLSHPLLYLTERSVERRVKRGMNSEITDFKDLPVSKSYIEDIRREGVKIKQVSKWFNGISCYISRSEIQNIVVKDYIQEIDLVARFKKAEDPMPSDELSGNNYNASDVSEMNIINYGSSFGQSEIINVPAVHNRGYTGQGILIASFDAGFNNLSHPCFASMLQRGVRTYDFVNGDTIVANGPGRMGDGAHGTLTLSLVAGYAEGNLVSPAFMSDYILAKTENTDSETPIEEDNWIAAAEWADSLGADIITSSLGYIDFDPEYPSYDWTWMSGDSTRITKGANIAAGKGIIVVNSAGNSGFKPDRNTLGAPGDGFNVLTVGAVNPNGTRAGYSSVGPTYLSNRIKPDVMAQGSFNVCAMPVEGNTGYTAGSIGTSLSTPMVAGVCALILNANHNLNPSQVIDILHSTSGNMSNPDNLIGWGTVDADAAVNAAIQMNNQIPADYILYQNYPNPFNPETKIRFELNRPGNVSLMLYDNSGRLIRRMIQNINFSAGNHTYSFDTDHSLATGVYYYTLLVNGEKAGTRKMVFLK